MERTERRLRFWQARRGTTFDTDQLYAEEAVRSRTARRVRAQLRRLDPVAMLTPRWSAPQAFLEDVALDLAVGEPAIGCRTVAFRPLMGRTQAEAWNFILRVLGELPGAPYTSRMVPLVVDRRGFFHAAEQLLAEAHEEAPYPVALLAHGCEHLPVEVLEDLAHVWARYASLTRTDRRCTVLLAGSVETPALDVGGAARVDLCDFGEGEAAAALIMGAGLAPPAALLRATKFTGGIPAVVAAVAEGASQDGLPGQPEELLRTMGPVADEVRGAVHAAMADADTAERLYALLQGEPLLEEPEVDHGLEMAGLLRRVRGLGAPKVELRSAELTAAAM
jgi:hypothetical protein